jgi:cyclophilin family peptidyl-prolyl cis-trans isomerase
MKLIRESIWNACMVLSILVTCSVSKSLADQSKPGTTLEFFHLETSKGTIDCALSGHQTVITHLQKQVNAERYNDSVVCRAVTNYFVQFGCDIATDTQTDGALRVRLPSTGGHEQPGTLSFAQYPGGDVGSQFTITTVKSPWLDGVQPVVGQCRPLDLIEELSKQPTLAGAVPRRPTVVIRAWIDRVESSPETNGLAK